VSCVKYRGILNFEGAKGSLVSCGVYRGILNCEGTNRHLVGVAKYRKILNCEFNLEFFKDKKDQCRCVNLTKVY